jgi:photosystem II stability/assembly factor-like uncharacterized protein
MRTLLSVVTLFFLVVPEELSAQIWGQQTNSNKSALLDVYFVNQDTGYVSGYNGTILKTVNGGTDWVAQNSGVTDALNGIQFIDEKIGYASGGFKFSATNFTLVKTINGGDTWTNVPVATSKSGGGIWFLSADTGFCAYAETLYGESVIAKTVNGGASWDVVYTGTGWISFFYFTDSKNGYATVSDGSVLKTTDGGQNWTSLNLGVNLWGSGIYFFSKDTGFVGGRTNGEAAIFKTVNAGVNWEPIASSNMIYQLFFADREHGFALSVDTTGAGKIIKSTDGGNTWLDETTPKSNLRGIYFLNTNLGYAVGDSGVILKYSIATSAKEPPQNIPARFSLDQNYPNPFNPSTVISYQLPTNSFVTLEVYDVLAREVNTLVNEHQRAGSHSVTFNASGLPSGVYFYRLEAGTYHDTKKLLLLK